MADDDIGKAQIIDLRELIRLDTDPARQASLRKLLIEEEDKLAKDRERVESFARHVREGKERLARLDRINSRHKNFDDHGLAQVMALTQQLVENFHQRVLSEYPYSVKLRDRTVGVCTTLDEARQRAQRFANANPEAVVSVCHVGLDRGETVQAEH